MEGMEMNGCQIIQTVLFVVCIALVTAQTALSAVEFVVWRRWRRAFGESHRRSLMEMGRRLGEMEREVREMRAKYDLMYNLWFERAKNEECERNHDEAYD